MKLGYLLCALVLAACAPPAEETPPAPPEAQQARAAGDCVAAAEAMHVQDAPQPNCDWAALAAATPQDAYIGYYDATRTGVEGGLAIAPRGDGGYAVGVSTMFTPSSHMCGGAFDGRIEGEMLALTPRDAAGEACTARLAPGGSPGDVTMQAQGDCTYFCGARATLDGVTFRRRSN